MAQTQKWQEINRAVVYHKYSQTIERRDYRMPDGQVRDYYLRTEPAGACAFALTTTNKVITIPQYRPGPDAILRELPGGRIDEGENATQAATRELLEETGYAGDVIDWAASWEADAYSQMNRNIIIIKNCKKVADPNLEVTEFGEIELVDIPDFVAQVRTGKLTDTAGAMLALDYLGFLREITAQ